MENKVTEIISEILKLNKSDLMTKFDKKEVWDSLRRVEILFALEDEFDIQFSEEELATLITPKKLYEAVLRKAEQE